MRISKRRAMPRPTAPPPRSLNFWMTKTPRSSISAAAQGCLAALKQAGFTTIDGGDVSAAMLAEARKKDIYRNLLELEVDAPLPFAPGTYEAISAIGVIGPGAAPITLFDTLMHGLQKGGKLLFSLNEKALEDRGALGMIHEWTDCGAAILLFAEEGPHLPGIDLKSTVYLIEKN